MKRKQTKQKTANKPKTATPGVETLNPAAVIEARINVGLGNHLFIRGAGAGLSWERGEPLLCVEPERWVWVSDRVQGQVPFKLLLNDERWMEGSDLVIQGGERLEIQPRF